jgi:hypothetical protein
MIEAAIFLAGAVVGVIMGHRWGRKDAAADTPLQAVSPQGGGGPVPEK